MRNAKDQLPREASSLARYWGGGTLCLALAIQYDLNLRELG